MRILGATGASVAAVSCSAKLDKTPVEEIIPYVIPEEGVIPGVATYYSSVCRECPAGCGLVVRTREGRAVKLEGNPRHPVNQGALCIRGQAGLQGLYNPDRIRSPHKRNEAGDWVPITWEEAQGLLSERLKGILESGKEQRVAFLTGNIQGSMDALLDSWLKIFRSENRVVYEPFSYESMRKAGEIVFGMDAVPTFRIEDSDFLLSFGADFMETWLSPVQYAKGFGQMHRPTKERMGKFVQVEPRRSMTGANADLWVSVKPGTEPFFALGVLNEVILHLWEKEGGDARKAMLRSWLSYQEITPSKVAQITGVDEATIRTVGKEFASAKRPLAIGSGVAGSATNATSTWVAAYILTAISGGMGKTIDFGRVQNVDRLTPFTQMVSWTDRLKQGEVDILLVYQTNPVYSFPASAGFSEALKKVPFVVSFSNFWDETTAQSHLVLPDHHPLESFGDYSPQTGVYGLYQPTMRPIFQTQQIGDTLLSVAASFPSNPFKESRYLDYLKASWKTLYSKNGRKGSSESFWQESLQRGGYWWETPSQGASISSRLFTFKVKEPELQGEGEYHLVVYPSVKFYEGRGANKPWLQEIPDPVTKVVWNSYVEIHPDAAERLGVRHGSVVELRSVGGSLKAPVVLNPSIQKETVAVPLGQGHEEYGRYAKGRGFNPLSILPVHVEPISGGFAWISSRVHIAPTGERALLVKTSGSTDDRDRGIAELVSFDDLKAGNVHREEPDVTDEILYDESWRHEKGIRWAMAIDTSNCTGCSACVAACYAENNVPIVGEEQCAREREMSWIRIETYEKSSRGEAHPVNVPMMCQQCGNAPCESVCPVYATYHNYEGLNVQVYNRCVGTRYCSNNCPYKVRRFNWFSFKFPEPLNLQLNPDLTVRDKGVMEKCTFCIQRIREGKDHAKDEGRLPRDGEIIPACAQTCPTNAIVFGDLNDPRGRVAQLARNERGYHAIEPIHTEPAITYLKRVRNDLRIG